MSRDGTHVSRAGSGGININEAEAEARAVNAEPWEPLPGMIKLRCPRCLYFFAAPAAAATADVTVLCPDCLAEGRRPLRSSPAEAA